jgi:hypothetical protein
MMLVLKRQDVEALLDLDLLLTALSSLYHSWTL